MVNVPGSLDDDTNQDPGRALRGARLNTRINSDGIMESGGVDLFLAGIEFRQASGAVTGRLAGLEAGYTPPSYPAKSPTGTSPSS